MESVHYHQFNSGEQTTSSSEAASCTEQVEKFLMFRSDSA